MIDATANFARALLDYPGFRDWQQKKMAMLIGSGTPFEGAAGIALEDFQFSDEIERQHDVIMGYIELSQTFQALCDCEYYFRRYPFRGLSLSKETHLTYICEMYFGRFYEFRERLKKYFAAISAAVNTKPNVSALLRQFDAEFGQQLRARNQVHHHNALKEALRFGNPKGTRGGRVLPGGAWSAIQTNIARVGK